uniref:Uncharacterized protein n=1 Tax=Anguilla anguilla TaxID=7936 RepID=A0A0E9PJ38_ANGAN
MELSLSGQAEHIFRSLTEQQILKSLDAHSPTLFTELSRVLN